MLKKSRMFVVPILLVLSLACQLFSLPIGDSPGDEIDGVPSLDAQPGNTPLPPTKTPMPTAVPTTEPVVLSDAVFDANVKESCGTDVPIMGYEDGVFSIGGGTLSIINGTKALWCYGARHTWVGEINYEGYVFASNENDPLQFEVVKDSGYVFVAGVGELTYPDGKTIELYRPTTAGQQPAVDQDPVLECQEDDGKEAYIRFSSPYHTGEVVIDGQISSNDEWSDAFCVDILLYEWGDMENGSIRRARWWVQNDDEHIYYLVRLVKESAIKGVAADYFWPIYTGTWEHSDGVFVNVAGEFQDMANWDESNFYNDDELSPPGSIDVAADVGDDQAFYWFEIRKALNSGDEYDWALEPGQVIGYYPDDSFLFAIIADDGTFFRNLQMKLGKP